MRKSYRSLVHKVIVTIAPVILCIISTEILSGRKLTKQTQNLLKILLKTLLKCQMNFYPQQLIEGEKLNLISPCQHWNSSSLLLFSPPRLLNDLSWMWFPFHVYYACSQLKATIKSFVCSVCNSFLTRDESSDSASAASPTMKMKETAADY